MKQLPVIFFFIFFIAVKSYCQNKKAFIKTIYPTSDSIPENILRFYIEFSEPIREENALSHIHLKNKDGKNMSFVFFDNNVELWNSDRTKLTLILDPARVKTGLKANEQMGRVFKEGTQYTLFIDSLFATMKGAYLSKNFLKKFTVIKEDTVAPTVKSWMIHSPKPNTKFPVIINFNESIDHISALTCLLITNRNGNGVKGYISLIKNESVWKFTPFVKWKKGEYKLFVNNQLEDIAANNLNGVFDHVKDSLKNNHERKMETIPLLIK